MLKSIKNSFAEFVPAIISIVLFALVFIGSYGHSSIYVRLTVGIVIVIGVLTFLFSKKLNGFGHKLFNTSLVVSMTFMIGTMLQTKLFSGFQPITSSGNFIVDKVFFNFLNTPWQSLFTNLTCYFVVFALFNLVVAKRLTK